MIRKHIMFEDKSFQEFARGCSKEIIQLIAKSLHRSFRKLPIWYLGLPTGANPRSELVGPSG